MIQRRLAGSENALLAAGSSLGRRCEYRVDRATGTPTEALKRHTSTAVTETTADVDRSREDEEASRCAPPNTLLALKISSSGCELYSPTDYSLLYPFLALNRSSFPRPLPNPFLFFVLSLLFLSRIYFFSYSLWTVSTRVLFILSPLLSVLHYLFSFPFFLSEIRIFLFVSYSKLLVSLPSFLFLDLLLFFYLFIYLKYSFLRPFFSFLCTWNRILLSLSRSKFFDSRLFRLLFSSLLSSRSIFLFFSNRIFLYFFILTPSSWSFPFSFLFFLFSLSSNCFSFSLSLSLRKRFSFLSIRFSLIFSPLVSFKSTLLLTS